MTMKVKDILGRIGLDKYEHFVLASLTAVVLKWALRIALTHVASGAVAFAAVVLFCIGKELVYDRWAGKGTCEWRDLWAGIVGAAIGVL